MVITDETDLSRTVTLRPSGDQSRWLRQGLADAFAAGYQVVLVDVATLADLSVEAARILTGARAFLRRRGGGLVVVNATPEMEDKLARHGMLELLELSDAEAIGELAAGPPGP